MLQRSNGRDVLPCAFIRTKAASTREYSPHGPLPHEVAVTSAYRFASAADAPRAVAARVASARMLTSDSIAA
jgi:hypothetical protein